ncbi:NYN domain-containing protein [Mycobacterium sp.]|uniref:NYN domain-containing protein n=1 Tax=Mycobacterium sp. TaxID=1785 RepID=UPI001273F809|nr:NYN domain-containing protein [Mycobacterium sp.]KAA8967057.1 MAG: RNA-binding protein [Mycobacterium sp.]
MRWIIDGMNVIGTRADGWWADRRRAMVALVDKLDRWASQNGEQVTVVFEGPPSAQIRSAMTTVTYAPRPAANSADDEIVRLVHADPRPHEIRVVTSDRALCERVRAAGASVQPAQRFRDLVESMPG